MKQVFGNLLIALGLGFLVLAIWSYPVRVRSSDGVVEQMEIPWVSITLVMLIVAAMLWTGIALRRSGRPSA